MAKRCPTCDIAYGDDQAFCARCGTALRAEGRGDLVGTVIGERYLVTAMIGEGGMGRVYRARHVRLPKDVAIKVLDARVARDPGALRRFSDEATRQSRVRNAHVVAVEDFGETADREPYLVMELVEGATLRDLLAEGPMAPARVVRLITQLADGLEAIHALPIVHRDLKPENVMITQGQGGSEQAKLLDFGIGKALDDSDKGRTQTGLVIGTPAYMSPEQVGGEPLDARSDIYALALMAYEMLAGRQTFTGNSPHEIMFSRLTSEPAPVNTVRQERGLAPISDAVDAVLTRALARDRGARTATATAFARELAEAMAVVTPAAVPAPAPASASAATSASVLMDAVASSGASPAAASAGRGASATPASSPTVAPTPSASAAYASASSPMPLSVGAASTSPSMPPAPVSSRRSILPLAVGGVLAIAAAVGAYAALVPAGPDAATSRSGGDTSRAAGAPASPTPAPTPAPTPTPSSPVASTESTTVQPPPSDVPPPARDTRAPNPVTATEARSSGAALAELEAIGALTEAADAQANSSQVLERTERVLPSLRSADDSAEAWIYRGAAFAMQDNRIEACRALARAKPSATKAGLIGARSMWRTAAECP
ncbi:MAG: serine/threonine protein kinase [Gemmatimonadaceae bacterium]|jgi:serine/threonine-protein kinase|nr:serine/threonine protein kinase [Gemmatimonadaceae bacterium]